MRWFGEGGCIDTLDVGRVVYYMVVAFRMEIEALLYCMLAFRRGFSVFL